MPSPPEPECHPVLETERLRLRRLVPGDADWVWELDQDAEVMRFISFGVCTPRDEFEEVILPRMLSNHAAGPQYGFFAALSRDGGMPLGWFHLRPDKLVPEDMELGYRLRRDCWGCGLATEGSRALIRCGLGEWGLPRIAAGTLAIHRASQRVMEKCGMRKERDFTCPEAWLPGTTEAQRRAVRYLIRAGEPVA